MKYLLILALLLQSCTLISNDMLPGIEYRAKPNIQIIEYSNPLLLCWDCLKLHKVPGWYSGCVWVPLNPAGTCIVRVGTGDKEALEHETQHCHGYADTWLPWMAKEK